jgi:hypothetical protein
VVIVVVVSIDKLGHVGARHIALEVPLPLVDALQAGIGSTKFWGKAVLGGSISVLTQN